MSLEARITALESIEVDNGRSDPRVAHHDRYVPLDAVIATLGEYDDAQEERFGAGLIREPILGADEPLDGPFTHTARPTTVRDVEAGRRRARPRHFTIEQATAAEIDTEAHHLREEGKGDQAAELERLAEDMRAGRLGAVDPFALRSPQATVDEADLRALLIWARRSYQYIEGGLADLPGFITRTQDALDTPEAEGRPAGLFLGSGALIALERIVDELYCSDDSGWECARCHATNGGAYRLECKYCSSADFTEKWLADHPTAHHHPLAPELRLWWLLLGRTIDENAELVPPAHWEATEGIPHRRPPRRAR